MEYLDPIDYYLNPRGWGYFLVLRPMGMCCGIGSHFRDWIDYNGVAFSIELLEWECAFFWDFGGQKILVSRGLKVGKIFTTLTVTNV